MRPGCTKKARAHTCMQCTLSCWWQCGPQWLDRLALLGVWMPNAACWRGRRQAQVVCCSGQCAGVSLGVYAAAAVSRRDGLMIAKRSLGPLRGVAGKTLNFQGPWGLRPGYSTATTRTGLKGQYQCTSSTAGGWWGGSSSWCCTPTPRLCDNTPLLSTLQTPHQRQIGGLSRPHTG